jgi:hypothetical protein
LNNNTTFCWNSVLHAASSRRVHFHQQLVTRNSTYLPVLVIGIKKHNRKKWQSALKRWRTNHDLIVVSHTQTHMPRRRRNHDKYSQARDASAFEPQVGRKARTHKITPNEQTHTATLALGSAEQHEYGSNLDMSDSDQDQSTKDEWDIQGSVAAEVIAWMFLSICLYE